MLEKGLRVIPIAKVRADHWDSATFGIKFTIKGVINSGHSLPPSSSTTSLCLSCKLL